MALGGVGGLYAQPPGLQWAMCALALAPGGGTSSPIAVPARLEANDRGTPGRHDVVGLGTLLPEGHVIMVAARFGAGDARIAAKVEEGGRVRSGDVLAVLDNEGQLQAAVEVARTAVGVSKAKLAQTRASEGGQAGLARAETAAADARREFERARELHRRGVVPEATLDSQPLTLAKRKKTPRQRTRSVKK